MVHQIMTPFLVQSPKIIFFLEKKENEKEFINFARNCHSIAKGFFKKNCHFHNSEFCVFGKVMAFGG